MYEYENKGFAGRAPGQGADTRGGGDHPLKRFKFEDDEGRGKPSPKFYNRSTKEYDIDEMYGTREDVVSPPQSRNLNKVKPGLRMCYLFIQCMVIFV